MNTTSRFFLVLFLFMNIVVLGQTNLIPYRDRDKWGFCDKEGKIIIAPKYDDAFAFENGLAKVLLKKKYGCVNSKGEVVVPLKYDDLFSWNSGVAKFSIDRKFGYVNMKGVEISPAQYETAEDFNEGYAFVHLKKWMVIDSTGKSAFDKQFPLYGEYNENGFDYGYLHYKYMEGLAKVKTDSGFIYINKKGEAMFGRSFPVATSFRQGVAIVEADDSGSRGMIDKTGKLVIPCEYNRFGYLSEGLRSASKNKKWGFLDENGKVVIDFIYDAAEDFENGLAVVESEESFGCIDKTGKVVIPFNFRFIGKFKDGLAAAKDYNYYGYINVKGEWIIKKNLEYASPFNEGLGAVQATQFSKEKMDPSIENKWGYVNAKGEWLVEPKYESASSFNNGIARVKFQGRWGYVGLNGKEYFIAGKYDTVTVSTVEEFIAAISSNRMICLNPGEYEFTDLENMKGMDPEKEYHDYYIAPKISFSSGLGITLEELENIAIVGLGKTPSNTRILSKLIGDYVLSFSGCKNISLTNLEMGHSGGGGGNCDGGVINIQASQNMKLKNMILFGSGTYGLTGGGINNLFCDNVTIKECTNGIMYFESTPCKNLNFSNCHFVNNIIHSEYSFIHFTQCDTVTFTGCTISENTLTGQYSKPAMLMKFDESGNIGISQCTITNNDITGLWEEAAAIKKKDIIATGNKFQK